jgi:glycosyltransferase involved in cell wall biosynthesis
MVQKGSRQVRRRVLLIAEAANPEWTSVPLIGWSLSRALARVADVHVVTQVRNRDAFVCAGLLEGRDFTAIDSERVAAPLYRLSDWLRGGAGKGWTTTTAFSSLAYYFFELELWRQFRLRIVNHEFDLVHRITPLSPTSQSIVAGRLSRLGVPYVIGPLNGGVPWPPNFIDRQHAEREWLSHVRSLYKVMPGYRSTRRAAAAIIVGSRYTYEDMPRWAKDKCVYIPENGVDLDWLEWPRNFSAHHPLRGGFVGRLVPYKGADILLEASAEYLRKGQLELHFIGDGPQRPELETLVDRLDIRSGVTFHGWLPHVDVQVRLSTCDFMALPSVREFGGGVVVEAMALGVPPVVADYAGPSELVDDATGIRVPFRDKGSLVKGLAAAIGQIVQSPGRLATLGAAARQKVRERLTWDAKANQILKIYDAVLLGRKDFSRSFALYGEHVKTPVGLSIPW